MELPVLNPGMADNDDISPVGMYITGQYNDAVSDGIDGTSEALGTPPVSNPVLSKMTSAPETP